MKYIYAIFGISLLIVSLPTYVQAAGCGTITYEKVGLTGERTTHVEQIENCDNPFNADEVVSYTPQLIIGETEIQPGQVLTSNPQEQLRIRFGFLLAPFNGAFDPFRLFLATEEGYVETDIAFRPEGLILTDLQPGQYTAVFAYEFLEFSQLPERSWQRHLRDIFLPSVAYAYHPDFLQVTTITFEVVHTSTEPAGASNVLFLPGIQASRLYKKGFLGSEDRIWPPSPNFGQDVRDLRMSATGESIKEVYTKDIIDTATGVGDVYKSFIAFVESQKTADFPIASSTFFAYDWRFGVEDIVLKGTQHKTEVKNLIKEVENLASSSYTDRVTIIAHSNGGLLAKALISELQNQNKSHLIDTLILIGVPHNGTPKAVGSLLHGYGQGDGFGGIVIGAHGARKAIHNMPGAYGLLPSKKYFEDIIEPIITFDLSATTLPYREIYGTEIDSFEEYTDFLAGVDGLERDIDQAISIPIRTNRDLMNEALLLHDQRLDTWLAPANVKVVEIVGTGVMTMKAIEYREIFEEKCVSAGPAGPICTAEAELKPYAKFTGYGDGTVVQSSAEAYSAEKERYYVNLEKLEELGLGVEYSHVNLMEIDSVQNVIKSELQKITVNPDQFISTQPLQFTQSYDIETIDSPVRLVATDENGNQTGVVLVDGEEVIKQEIPGSQYFEFGGTKYFIVPSTTNRKTRLYGEDFGGYTLTIAELDSNGNQTIKTVLANATTTNTLVAEYTNVDGEYSHVFSDINGDGIVDIEQTLTGIILYNTIDVPVDLDISTTKSQANTTGTRVVRSPDGEVAGITTFTQDIDQAYRAELFGLLQELSHLLELLSKR